MATVGEYSWAALPEATRPAGPPPSLRNACRRSGRRRRVRQGWLATPAARLQSAQRSAPPPARRLAWRTLRSRSRRWRSGAQRSWAGGCCKQAVDRRSGAANGLPQFFAAGRRCASRGQTGLSRASGHSLLGLQLHGESPLQPSASPHLPSTLPSFWLPQAPRRRARSDAARVGGVRTVCVGPRRALPAHQERQGLVRRAGRHDGGRFGHAAHDGWVAQQSTAERVARCL